MVKTCHQQVRVRHAVQNTRTKAGIDLGLGGSLGADEVQKIQEFWIRGLLDSA